MEYDVSVRGRHVSEHFTVNFSPGAAEAVRAVLSDFREHCREDPAWYGLREDEDEALEALVDALTPEDEEDEGGPLVTAGR